MNPCITNRHRPMTDEVVRLWEAFGCVPRTSHLRREPGPLVRPSMNGRGGAAVTIMRDYDSLDPDTGVHYIRITLPDGTEVSAHGDDVTGCFIRVYGMDESYVREMYERIEAAMPAFLNAVWRPQ